MKLLRCSMTVASTLAIVASTHAASATGFTDTGQDIVPRQDTTVKLEGYLRTRAEALYNLDLDRGLTPSGQPLFPVPIGDPTGQTLTHADMRLRTDLAVYAPFGGVAMKARIDWLDNIPLGGNADGIPSASSTQLSPASAMRVKRAYGEVLTPLGLIAAGRMGNNWGLGMFANGGDCADCDSGDAADRVAFITSLANHIWALAYDFSASGPFTPSASSQHVVDLAPSAAVRSITFAMLQYKDDLARRRRRIAGKTTVEYGGYLSHRTQNNDVPATYLPTAQAIPINDAQVTARGFNATVFDLWARVTHPWFRIEAEWAMALATVVQPSLIPGVLYHDPVTSKQHGGALESEIATVDSAFGAGLDLGYASGDASPGFGAFPKVGAPAPKPGDLDGAQANPPFSNHADNFRFHPDYRIDRILFREIIGTVTDAVYVRPHARLHLVRSTAGALTASVAAVQSWALFASSTPGEKSPLGIEIDPTLAWGSRDGFGAAFEYAVLFPLAGLDNPTQHLLAKPAQLARVRLMYRF